MDFIEFGGQGGYLIKAQAIVSTWEKSPPFSVTPSLILSGAWL
jgi:hypothetical protein